MAKFSAADPSTNASGNRAAAKRAGFVNTLKRRLRVHRVVIRRWSGIVDIKEVFEVCAEERRLERERLLPLFVRVFNAGYQAGHHETVEGGFADVHESDKETYHSDVVAELLGELLDG
jgi:hypothetical protein